MMHDSMGMASTSSLAIGGVKRKACLQCTKSKRKCDKQAPFCRRCIEKGSRCKYPPKRVSAAFDDDAASSKGGDIHELENPLATKHFGSDINSGKLLATNSRPIPSDVWFLSPETWALEHNPEFDEPRPYGEDALHDYIAMVTSWLERWVVQGSNPLIHAHLYRISLPTVMEDAYTSVAAFLTKNDANKAMIMRMLENRVRHLTESQPDTHDGSVGTVMIDTMSHLARTQALFIYQLIRLFDGDIRARAQAEMHIGLLQKWAKQMWESATMDIGMVRLCSTFKDAEEVRCSMNNAFQTDGTAESLWHAWIVGESIRRTYLATICVLSVYSTLKQGWSPCPGGLTFTSRSGLWDASSPYKWLEASRFGAETSIQSLRCGKLFEESRPNDVDDFTTSVLMVSHGKERLERWAAEKGVFAS